MFEGLVSAVAHKGYLVYTEKMRSLRKFILYHEEKKNIENSIHMLVSRYINIFFISISLLYLSFESNLRNKVVTKIINHKSNDAGKLKSIMNISIKKNE